MSRSVPPSPRVGEDLLDRTLNGVAAPKVPEGLAARIKREVPRMAQLPPLVEPGPITPEAVATPATGVLPQVRQPGVQPGTPLPRRRWLAVGTGGIGALAAGFAVIALLGPAQQQAETAVPVAPAAPLAAAPATPQGETPGNPPAAAQARMAAAPAAVRPQGNAAPKVEETVAHPTQPPAAELAIATPPKAEQSAEKEEATSANAPAPGYRGQMGPVLPQGYGFTGSMGGPAIPSSAPVQMSGGPGSGSAPH
ncbi:hypothetical protein [Novosphingobium cyanobacteriorum]|uniref:Uncharacterized protein n=1 Tax=Novosphingobium cyanobacteriorum TaxID=3024215 RepID=A0ABT6CDC7_9SPHN|nr:hypothetical protein [Novosphingobium cyanobacteriorum]MDF8331930.1 hypothetical protein [Novosphingobium cyanobacteriorum]